MARTKKSELSKKTRKTESAKEAKKSTNEKKKNTTFFNDEEEDEDEKENNTLTGTVNRDKQNSQNKHKEKEEEEEEESEEEKNEQKVLLLSSEEEENEEEKKGRKRKKDQVFSSFSSSFSASPSSSLKENKPISVNGNKSGEDCPPPSSFLLEDDLDMPVDISSSSPFPGPPSCSSSSFLLEKTNEQQNALTGFDDKEKSKEKQFIDKNVGLNSSATNLNNINGNKEKNNVLFDMLEEDERFFSLVQNEQSEEEEGEKTYNNNNNISNSININNNEDNMRYSIDVYDNNEGNVINNNRCAKVPAGRIESLIVENFKSYRHKQNIGPFTKLSAIIGPNGAGKSNLMDALSFVLGVQSRHLRGTHLGDLIYRGESENTHDRHTNNNNNDTLNNRKCSVTLVFVKNCSTKLYFCRRISPKGIASFYINGKLVSYEEYVSALADLNILVKARNFLVFQGGVEQIAQKDPMELTQLFEHIAGTDSLKDEYESSHSEYRRLQSESRHVFFKKKHLEAEKNDRLKEKIEAEEYKAAQEQLSKLAEELYLFKLYHNEIHAQKLDEEKRNSEKKLKEAEERMKGVRSDLQKKEAERAQNTLQNNQKDKLIQNFQNQIANLRREMMRLDVENEAAEKKIANIEKSKQNEQKLYDELLTQQKELERELDNTEREIKRLNEDVATAEGGKIQMNLAQKKSI